MANILILTLVFQPDSVSTAQILGELGKDLQARGHKVTVLTTSPHYNRDPEAESRQLLRRYWGPILRKSNYHGIEVYHTFMPRKGKSVFLRLLSWVGFHLISTIAGMSVIPKPSIIIVPSPPLTIGLSAWILGKFHDAPYIYNVQEIYPDIAISLGALRNMWLIKLLFRLESFVYKKASCITVIAPRMRKRLLEKGVPADKVKVIPNFVDIDDLRPLVKDNEFSRQYNVHKKFVVSYAGNMGPAQDIETIIKCVKFFKDMQNIHFMLIGDGMLRDKLKEKAKKLKLTNVTFIPHQPYSLVPQIYAASDLCLVPQLSEITSSSIPSKVYRIMACSRPVLAATELQSDLAELVSNARCGFVVKSGSAESLAEAIIKASKRPDLLCSMGRAGRDYVVKNYTRETISKLYHELITSLVKFIKVN